MRAAMYARVSTADGRQDTENQLAELRRFASTQGWEIAAEYIDHESGGRADRREFCQMFTDAAQRQFDVLLFRALDRLTREGALETLQYLNRLSSYGVGFRSFTEPYLDSCGIFKDAVIAILGVIAKQERIRMSERVRAGLNRAKERGTRSGNPVGRPKVIFDWEKVADLRNQGRSWREIARACDAGVTTVRRAYGSMSGNEGVPKSRE